MWPAAAPAALRPCASVAPAASAAAFLAAPASSTPSGSLERSHTTPARVNTCASWRGELLVVRGRHQPRAGVHHLLRVRRAPEARHALGAERRLEDAGRRRAIRRDEALGHRHHRRAPPQAGLAQPRHDRPERLRGHRQEHVVGARHARRGRLDAQLRRQLHARQVGAVLALLLQRAAPARRCGSAASCAGRRAPAAPPARCRTSRRRSPSRAWPRASAASARGQSVRPQPPSLAPARGWLIHR